MSKKRVVYAGMLLTRQGRVYIRPRNAESRQELDCLSFQEGAALYSAVIRLASRSGAVSLERIEQQNSPYKILSGKSPFSKKASHKPKQKPVEKRCFVCNVSGDGGVTCKRVKCRERADA